MINVPTVYEIYGDTMVLEYIRPTAEPDIEKIIDIVLTKFVNMSIECPDFNSYVDRIDDHVKTQKIDVKFLNVFIENTGRYHLYRH